MREPIADRLEWTPSSDRDPVIPEARVLVEGVAEPVAREGSPHLLEDVLIAVVVEVREDHAVALLEMTEGPRVGHVGKAAPVPIAIGITL